MAILCDLTEFMTSPLRTGIQRVTFEIVSRWPGPCPLLPICMNQSQQFSRLPASECFDLIRAFFQEEDEVRLQSIKVQLQKLTRQGQPLPLKEFPDYDGLYTPEMFYCGDRIALYEKLSQHKVIDIFMTVHDFLLWSNPELFPKCAPLASWPFLKMLRSVPHIAYDSEKSRQVAEKRIFRGQRATGVTIPLGADGLGVAAPRFNPKSRSFVVIGTIEPRKGHFLVLDAFERLWAQGHSIPLVFVGRRGWLNRSQLSHLEQLHEEQPLFAWHSNLRDRQVRDVILESRATIFLSQHEGFGLPPMESLALGKPVIVSAGLPSLERLPAHGQIRLLNPTPSMVQSAVLELMDDKRGRKITDEIASLDLLTWDQVSRNVADWIAQTLAARKGRSIAFPLRTIPMTRTFQESSFGCAR